MVDNEIVASNARIDVVMWSRNRANLLPGVLSAIDLELAGRVNKKVFVVGNISDSGVPIARDFHWDVYSSGTWGIGAQANEALSHVESEYFASIESDILLRKGWFENLFPLISGDSRIAVAHGITLPEDNKLRKFESFFIQRRGDTITRFIQSLGNGLVALSNNLYRTSVIREVGGFDTSEPVSVDHSLRDAVTRAGYRWIIKQDLVSTHLGHTLQEVLAHSYTQRLKSKRQTRILKLLAALAFSPITGAELARWGGDIEFMKVYVTYRALAVRARIEYLSSALRN
ncbi:MAG: glycosyltransferase [Nitrososphaerota archaeon]|nr:glycosyltransferase [Nitrososphaerota archaeon]